jgi:hypothetical protein
MKLQIIIFLIPFFCLAQFKINNPTGWMDYSSGNEEKLNRITVFGSELTDALIENSDLDLKKFTELNYYTKFDMYSNESNRSIPAIRVYMLKNYMNKSLKELKEYYLNALKAMESSGLGYENVNITKAKNITINGKTGIEFMIEFEFLNPYLEIKEKHRGRSYYFFISESYYLQINMNDTEYDKCDRIFDRTLAKIKF